MMITLITQNEITPRSSPDGGELEALRHDLETAEASLAAAVADRERARGSLEEAREEISSLSAACAAATRERDGLRMAASAFE
jgi:uncharacterized protein (DUF3084 family)